MMAARSRVLGIATIIRDGKAHVVVAGAAQAVVGGLVDAGDWLVLGTAGELVRAADRPQAGTLIAKALASTPRESKKEHIIEVLVSLA